MPSSMFNRLLRLLAPPLCAAWVESVPPPPPLPVFELWVNLFVANLNIINFIISYIFVVTGLFQLNRGFLTFSVVYFFVSSLN